MEKQENNSGAVQSLLKPWKVFLPVFIGLAVVAWMFYSEYEPGMFDFLRWTWAAAFWLFVALLMMIARDWAYIYRIHLLADKKISWKQAFNIIMLWEFSSAVSPSVVGGVAPAIFFMYKEGVNPGKSSAIVMTCIFLDEVFFILMAPILFFILGTENIFVEDVNFWVVLTLSGGYVVIFLYTLFLGYGLFVNPYWVKTLLSNVFLLPVLRKWRMRARKSGNQLILVSNELKGKGWRFWLRSFVATFISWTARYWVVNFMFLAFFAYKMGYLQHMMVYGRQLIMWLIMLISPTPGASGIAEKIFQDFLGDILPNLSWAIPLAMLWRLISYYPYLIIGAIMLPKWLKKTHS